MRKTLFRSAVVAVAATVLSTVALPSGVASAATTDDCVKERSVRLYTQGPGDADRLWVDWDGTRIVVCFTLGSQFSGGLTIVADTSSSVTRPDVVGGTDPALCPQVVQDIFDPVRLRLAVNLSLNAVCLTVGETTKTVRFVPGSFNGLPDLEIWRDGGADWGWIDVAFCPQEYAIAVVFGGPTTCLQTNERVFP